MDLHLHRVHFLVVYLIDRLYVFNIMQKILKKISDSFLYFVEGFLKLHLILELLLITA